MFDNVYAAVMVKDTSSVATWYETLLGRPADSSPMDGLLQWHFEGGGMLQVGTDPSRAGHSTATLSVADRDAVMERLVKKSIAVVQTMESDVTKIAIINDPEGNQLIIAQLL